MAVRPVRVYGDPVLRRRAVDVRMPFTEPLDDLIHDMFDSMEAERGIGLAAPQIGVSQRIMVLRVPRQDGTAQDLVLVNPEFLEMTGSEVAQEGCLSIPGVSEDVKRAWRTVVRGVTPKGETEEFEADGLFARALQHEMDHLDGVLFIDRLSLVRRRLLKKSLEEITRRAMNMAAA
jgi:peptide deformylase